MHMSANMQEMIMEIVTRYGFQVLGALAILVAGLLVARWTLQGIAALLPQVQHTGRVTQVRVFLSEWTKLRSVRSTRWYSGWSGAGTFPVCSGPCVGSQPPGRARRVMSRSCGPSW